MCSVQRLVRFQHMQHACASLKNLRYDQRAPGGLNSRKSDLVYNKHHRFPFFQGGECETITYCNFDK